MPQFPDLKGENDNVIHPIMFSIGGHGNPLQYSCLENPMDRGEWQAIVHELQRVRHNLASEQPPPHRNKTKHYVLKLHMSSILTSTMS